MKLLLDTCTFLWIASSPAVVPPNVLQQFRNPENDVFLSAASSWEIAIKHAGPEIAAWVANEALRHRRVPLGFGCVALSESCEVCSQACVVAWLRPLDELLHLDCVQHSRRFLLRGHAPCERQDGNRSDRHWTDMDGSHDR